MNNIPAPAGRGVPWIAAIGLVLIAAILSLGVLGVALGFVATEELFRSPDFGRSFTTDTQLADEATLRERCADAAGDLVLAGGTELSHTCRVEGGRLMICDTLAADGPTCQTEPLPDPRPDGPRAVSAQR